jgi:type I restriction enzyme S subunit
MGSSFSQVKLADVAHIIMGQSPKGETYNTIGEGDPLLNGPTEFGASHPTPSLWTTSSTKLCNKGDILFCVRGSTTGRMNWADREYCIGRGIGAFRVKTDACDTRFLWYQLIYELPRLLSLSAGSVFPNLARQDFDTFSIDWPDRTIRAAITSILGALDDKIELNRKMNETLEATARAIFKSWFVDFEPIPGYSPHKEWQDSPLGKIPKGWRVGTLGELVDFINERVEATPEKDKEKYIALDDMPHRSIDIAQFRFGSEVNSSIIRFREGDILFGAMRPYFHKVGLAQFNGITRTTTFVLRPKQPPMRLFALMNFFSDSVIEYATNASVGSTIPYIKWDALVGYQILMLPEDLMAKFNDFVMPIIQQIKMNSDQSRTLAAIRDALLPKLLSGEIRVKEVDKFMESAR